jgi:uncharacterized protein YutE (UPF0331/DUF86 family)
VTSSDIADKAAFVRQALDELSAIPQTTCDDFLADRRNLPATLHLLQTAIQGLVDIGLILVSARGLRTPRTSIDVIELLEEAGALPAGSATMYRPVIGFRNRVVHLYDRIDPEIVYRILTEERSDLVQLLALLLDIAAA